MFVGKSEGKLRDYYRIGKILGTGTYFYGVLTASGHTQTQDLTFFRRVRRGKNVRAP